jgi:tripartite-type tricarboxylate transporter receptor subunit TctC
MDLYSADKAGLHCRGTGRRASFLLRGKTMHLIVSTSPGGATDIAGRLVARYLGKYIPGQPEIIVQNMPGAGGIVSANYLFSIAKADGLTTLAVNRANYLSKWLAGRK